MNRSHSFGNQVSRFHLAVKGAQHNAAAMTKDAVVAAKSLQKIADELATLNATQEQAKHTVVALTAEVKAQLRAARGERAKIVNYAEAAFGKRGIKLREFRPRTEGKVHRRMTKAEKQAAAEETTSPRLP